MIRRAIALFACMILCGTSVSSLAAEISGTWKIDTRGGPVPLCGLAQVGTDLIGSCVGPGATGSVSGTVIGPSIRWRWQFVGYARNATGTWDFVGILRPDNTITGVADNRKGRAYNFTAKRQSTALQRLPVQGNQAGQRRQGDEGLTDDTEQPLGSNARGFLGPYQPNAYGPGINSDATGRPFSWQPLPGNGPADPNATVTPDVFGPGIGEDEYGRPVQPACPPLQQSC